MDNTESKAENAIREAIKSPRGVKNAIDALVPHLSDWDLVYLRWKVRNIPTNPSNFSSWTDLKADILYQIVSYLSIEDFVNFRLVSKRWKQLWMEENQEIILNRALRQFFGGIQKVRSEVTDLEQLLLLTHFSCRRKDLDDCAMAFVPWDILHPSARDGSSIEINATNGLQLSTKHTAKGFSDKNESIPLYNDGKVAWQSDANLVIVDNLFSGRRMQYTLGQDPRKARKRMQLVALTKQLIVLAVSPSENSDTFRVL